VATRVLVSETVKRSLLEAPAEKRAVYRKAFEYLENGLWDGGLQVKKLRGLSGKTILEGRVGRSDRLLMTLGKDTGDEGEPLCLVYVWAIVLHDQVDARARAILPDSAPFLSFTAFSTSQASDIELEKLDDSHFTQEPVAARVQHETSAQKWFLLDEKEWKRVLLYSGGEFDLSLYLTPEQRELLRMPPPVLLSGTAGSGKTTMAVYYLTHPRYMGRSRLFLTYNLHLRNFSERLYRSLMTLTERDDQPPPEFLTFRELCLRLLGLDGVGRFRPEREIDLDAFRNMLRRLPAAGRFDAALVWEEIRSIIKGAKPQLDAQVLGALLTKLEKGANGAALTSELREELLALRRLSLSEKAERVVQRLMGCGLREISSDLPKLLETRRPALIRVLHSLRDVVGKHEADFHSPLMTFDEYERLGRKRAPSFLQDRRKIYQIAEWYQKNLEQGRLWDEIDLTRAAIRSLDKRRASWQPYDFVCCDEVQDFTDVQLSLIVRLPCRPINLILGGDPKQIVNPSGFRWEEVKDLFYDRAVPVPPVHHLTLNFRCVGSIVLLSNALLELKQRLLGIHSDERLDDWKFQGRPPFLIEGVSPDELIEALRITAPDRVVLTRSDADRDLLKRRLGTELVFTIREAKGLEFRTVVLWGFGGEASINTLWSRMLSEDTARLHDAHVRHEINLLYVGITRAQQDLILYDGPTPSTIWSAPLFADLVHRSGSTDFIDEAWRATRSPADWERQGDYFMDFEHYRAAAECYRNAERPDRMARARALAAEKQKEFASAADWWEKAGEPRRTAESYEKAGQPGLARPIWQEIGDRNRAEDCRVRQLELDGSYAEAAAAREKRKEFEKAIENWRKARRPDCEARLWEKLKKPVKAAEAYTRANDFANAARIYLKLRRKPEAARCLEQAGRFEEALELWRRLKKPDDLLRCAGKSGNALAIGDAHESRGEWKLALEAYRRSKDQKRRAQWMAQSILPAKGRSGYARKAIRLELLGHEGAAEAWVKSGEYELAALAYRREGNFQAAGNCFVKLDRHVEAAGMYARSPEDRAAGFKALRRCFRRSGSSGRWGRWGMLPAEEWVALARSLRSSKEFDAAAAVYSVLHIKDEEAACLLQGGRIEEALQLWLHAGRCEPFLKTVEGTGLYRLGVDLLQKTFLTSRGDYFYQDSIDVLEILLRGWWATEKSEALREELAPRLDILARKLPLDLMFEILGPLGQFDGMLLARDAFPWGFRMISDPQILESRIKKARQLEKGGDPAGAGLWYLCGDSVEEARRCWESLPVNEHNHQTLIQVGMGKHVAEYHISRNELRQAGWLLCKIGEVTRGADLLDQAGLPEKAAEWFDGARMYDEAYRLYLKAGARKKAARMLEKMKKWQEAEVLYYELGDFKKASACRNKSAGKTSSVSAARRLF
jgi:tetratricopeptide (TPR) repeat protein